MKKKVRLEIMVPSPKMGYTNGGEFHQVGTL